MGTAFVSAATLRGHDSATVMRATPIFIGSARCNAEAEGDIAKSLQRALAVRQFVERVRQFVERLPDSSRGSCFPGPALDLQPAGRMRLHLVMAIASLIVVACSSDSDERTGSSQQALAGP